MSTAIVIMAAGESQRMGKPKQLLPYRGTTLLRHAVQTALDSQASSVIVILGANEDQLRSELDGLSVQIASNPKWKEGMGSSIHAGVAQVRTHPEVTSLILTVADQPLLMPETYNRLIASHLASGLPVVASSYSDTVGVPVLFADSLFDALAALPPDQGCKGLILKNGAKSLRLPCPEAAVDVDTPADFSSLTE